MLPSPYFEAHKNPISKVLTTLGVDIGQYLAVNLGPAAGNDAATSNLDIQCLHLMSEHTKIENIEVIFFQVTIIE